MRYHRCRPCLLPLAFATARQLSTSDRPAIDAPPPTDLTVWLIWRAPRVSGSSGEQSTRDVVGAEWRCMGSSPCSGERDHVGRQCGRHSIRCISSISNNSSSSGRRCKRMRDSVAARAPRNTSLPAIAYPKREQYRRWLDRLASRYQDITATKNPACG